MRSKAGAIVVSAAILGMTLALPSFAMATVNGRSDRSAGPMYAQAGATNPGSVDDATLRRAAAAYVKVRDISVREEQAINKTDDTARKEQLAAESESAKLAAVNAQGMNAQQYNNVIQMVKADSSLQQKFLSYVQELSHAS